MDIESIIVTAVVGKSKELGRLYTRLSSNNFTFLAQACWVFDVKYPVDSETAVHSSVQSWHSPSVLQ